MLIINKYDSQLKKLQKELEISFWMTDLGGVLQYLGIAMIVNNEKSKNILCRTAYLYKVLNKFNRQDCRLVSTFIEPGIGNVLFFRINKLIKKQ